MKKIFSILCAVFCYVSLFSQDCYTGNRSNGIAAYRNSNYESAKVFFIKALRCPMKPMDNDIETWIAKCDEEINKYYITLSTYSVNDDTGEGGSISIRVSTNDSQWLVQHVPSFCSVTNTNSDSFVLMVNSNGSFPRTDYLNVTTRDESVIKKIIISQSARQPTASIEKVSVDYNVYENGQKGMRIHVKFHVNYMLQKEGKLIAYFYDGYSALKDCNNEYCTIEGNVCCSKVFTPSYENSSYNDFVLFMPNNDLHLNQSKYDLKFIVQIYDISSMKFLAKSDYTNFKYTINR